MTPMSVRPQPAAPTAFDRVLPEEAWAWIDAHAAPVHSESAPLARAAGRVLASAVTTDTDLPRIAQAGTDGFALRAADTEGASDYSPLPLRLAARGASVLKPGEAVEVGSGEPLPAGADAVLPLEAGEIQGGQLEVSTPIAAGEDVARIGEEARAGERLLPAGRRLRPQDLAWLALAGITEVEVVGRPRVRVLLAGQFEHDADGPLLTALVARDGGVLVGCERAPDLAALQAALRQPGADLVLIAGGTGLGPDDEAAAALAREGELAIHGLAMHPGDTAGLGRVGEMPVALLPGMPLACLCAYDVLASRLLRRLAGLSGEAYRRCELPLARKVASRLGSLEVCRVRIVDGRAEPLAIVEGRVLASAVRADGFFTVPVQSEGHAEGEVVTVRLYGTD